jgi:hypothetical protein
MNQLAVRAIRDLQAAMESPEFISTELGQFTDHFFAPGIYLRTLFVPAGFVVIGANHLYDTLNIMLKGKASIINDYGEKVLAEAPFIFTSKPGQKAGFAITDVWYAAIHYNPDDIKDIPTLEQMFFPMDNILEASS